MASCKKLFSPPVDALPAFIPVGERCSQMDHLCPPPYNHTDTHALRGCFPFDSRLSANLSSIWSISLGAQVYVHGARLKQVSLQSSREASPCHSGLSTRLGISNSRQHVRSSPLPPTSLPPGSRLEPVLLALGKCSLNYLFYLFTENVTSLPLAQQPGCEHASNEMRKGLRDTLS